VILTFFSLFCFYRRFLARYYADSCSCFAASYVPDASFLRFISQSATVQIQIGQRKEHKQGIGIIAQAMVTNLGKTKHAFYHRKDMLHPGTDFRLGAVACLGRLIQRLIATALLVGEVLYNGRHLANDLRLSGVSRISAHSSRFIMQQVFHHLRVVHVGHDGSYRMNLLFAATASCVASNSAATCTRSMSGC
jgi:hypothetical protein